MSTIDLHQPKQIQERLERFFRSGSHRRSFFSSREKFRAVGAVHQLEFNEQNVIYSVALHYRSTKKISAERPYILILYFQGLNTGLWIQDQTHIQEILKLDIYPFARYKFVPKDAYFKYPFLLLEGIPDIPLIENLRADLELANERAVNQRIDVYLSSSHAFHKRGNLLVSPGERFLHVVKTKKLALGLNNAVYEISVKVITQQNTTELREFILRVYPENKNLLKVENEALRLQTIQHLDIPKAKFYLYERNLHPLGYRFLILQKLQGKPIQEVINTFSPEQTQAFLADLARILGNLHNIRSDHYESYYISSKITKNLPFDQYIYDEVKTILTSFRDLDLDKELDVDIKYLFKWLKGHKPLLSLDGYSFVHGDLRPSNIIVKDDKIQGLIDWEMSCLSDPAQDLGWTLFFFKLYKNLEDLRGFFFTKYWEYCKKYDFEARVYFYEFIAAMKLYIYTRWTKVNNPEKYDYNRDFFNRVENTFPRYIETVTYRTASAGMVGGLSFDEEKLREKIQRILIDSFMSNPQHISTQNWQKVQMITEKIMQTMKECEGM